jgi:phosphotriesterase-related protein
VRSSRAVAYAAEESVVNSLPTREQLRGRVQTVLGLCDPAALGATLMHEHVLCDIRPPRWRDLRNEDEPITLSNRFAIDYGEIDAPGNLVLDRADLAVEELRRMRLDGGNAVVELSCGGLHPDPLGLVRVAEQSGATLVMGCGHYVEEYQHPDNHLRSVDDFTREMVEQIFVGAWGTRVRAGIIGEIGCQMPWTPLERRVMAAAVQAQRESVAAVSVHPGRHPDQPQEVAEFLRGAGADLARVIMSHVDRTIFDDDRLFRLADSGIVLELDLFGMETTHYKWADIDMPNDGERLRVLRKLIDRGHLHQIVISHDICYRSRLSCFGGHGYGHIFRNIVPLMRRRHFDRAEIDTILIDTPRRLLTFV